MPFFDKPFLGQDENPLVKSVFFRTWGDDVPTPPPGSDLMISESGDFMITESTADFMITE